MAKGKTKSSLVLTARDLLKGYVANKGSMYGMFNMTPMQFLEEDEKDTEWVMWNMDYFERIGFYQISNNYDKFTKNYNMANGILDMHDYVPVSDNPYGSMVDVIAKETGDVGLPKEFYPIIPNIINTFTGEFTKRTKNIYAEAIDEFSRQEMFEDKFQKIQDILIQDIVEKKKAELQNQGVDINSKDPQIQQQVQQELSTAQKLVQTENQFKSYRSIVSQWANHMININESRFNISQLEEINFRNALTVDREFWHIRLTENDVKLEIWNPKFTFYHKSPDTWWISEGNYVGRQLYMSATDIINLYGDQLKEDDINKIVNFASAIGITGSPYVTAGYDRPSSYYDTSKPYPEAQKNITTEKYYQEMELDVAKNPNISVSLKDLMGTTSAVYNSIFGNPILMRVTEAYWISQRKVGKLTIMKDGVMTVNGDLVDSRYKVMKKPIYDKSLEQVEKAENLIDGEHIEWIWINEVRRAVKIGSNRVMPVVTNNVDFTPIYLDGKRLPFEFKGQNNKFSVKLPVEGKIFSEYNTESHGLVDKLKGFQVGYNVVNNQIMEFLADNVGKVLVIDPNSIPRNSFDGSWGKHNFPKFYQVMKDFKIAPIDPSASNVEGAPSAFNHMQQIDLSNTDRIMMNIKLAEYFKNEAFATVGVSQQRMGTILASESATGVNQAVNNSYSQTEWYFEQHMNHLMPRVHQQLLEAQQYLCATNPDVQLSYLNTSEENVFFKMEGWKTLLTDLHVYSKSTADVRQVMQKLEQLAMSGASSGTPMSDLMKMVTMKTPSEVIEKVEKAEVKRQQDTDAQRQHEQDMQDKQQQFLQEQEVARQQYDDMQKQKDRDNQLEIAKIRASTMDTADLNANQSPDNIDYINNLTKNTIHQDNMSLKERQHNDKMNLAKEELNYKNRQLSSNQEIENKKLQIVKTMKKNK